MSEDADLVADGDEAMLLFGESEDVHAVSIAAPFSEEFTVSVSGRLPEVEPPAVESRIMKFPSSALKVDFHSSASSPSHSTSSSQHSIRCRPCSEGGATMESNSRLVEWEDGTWTLIVGSEQFRVFERSEKVHLFDKQVSLQGETLYVSAGSVGKQFNVIPGSLESRAHRQVVEKSAVSRKLNEARKVTLAHGLLSSVASSTVSTKSAPPPTRPKSSGLTAEFLEAGLGGVKSIKAQYKSDRKRSRRDPRSNVVQHTEEEEEEEDEDVEFDPESSSSSSSSVSSDDESSSPSSSSSGSSSSSDSESSSSEY